jgi:predicted ester cyclase
MPDDPLTTRNKAVITRLVEEVFNGGRLELIDELYAPEVADQARAWITPFRTSFPDVRVDTIELIAEHDQVVGRFTCSATHLGDWLGHPPTGRRFDNVDEINIYRLRDGRIIDTWTLEDNLARLTQLGLPPTT